MAKFLKVSLMIFLIEMSIEVSTSMYDISRGDIDMYSYTILKPKEAKKCGGNYCSCSELKTFIYQIGAQKGNCVKDTDIRLQSSCKPFSNNVPIQIVHQKDSAATGTQLQFMFIANSRNCVMKSTEYTVSGNFWLPIDGNPGRISLQRIFRTHQLQIDNPSVVLSTFPGMLLKVQIECFSRPFGTSQIHIEQTCLLLKIEGKTNVTSQPVIATTPSTVPDFSTAATSTPAASSTSPTTSSSTSSPTTSSPASSTWSTTNTKAPAIPERPNTKDHSSNVPTVTTQVPRSSSTTLNPSDPENENRQSDENDSNNLVPILVPILLLFVLLVLLFGIFLYRRRERSMSRKISNKGFYDGNSLPQHAALTKAPKDSPQSYAIPESQISASPIYDTVYENTNLPRGNSPNYYEFEDDDYATYDDAVPSNTKVHQNPADQTSPPSSVTHSPTAIYQEADSNGAQESTTNSKDNLGYNGESNGDPYYYSLENTLKENIYDKVTEEPQEHVYNVLEGPN